MVEVEYINGGKDTYETRKHCKRHWIYKKSTECFEIKDIQGKVVLPREFVKSIRHIKV